MTGAKRLLGILAVLTWIGVPLVVAGVLTARSERSVRSEQPASVWVMAGPVETEVRRTVAARAEWRELPPLLAPAWSGLVEEVGLRVGEPVRSGDTVAVIDGIPRLAAATERPFSRRLVRDDRGQDVADLNAWLASIGHEASDGDLFGAATQRGVFALRQDLNVPSEVDEFGQPIDLYTFDPAWVVFLGQVEATVSSIGLQVGAPAPPAGSAIAEFTPRLVSVKLELAGQTMSAGPSPDESAGPTSTTDASEAGAPGTGGPDLGSAPGSTPSADGGSPLLTAAEGATLERSGQEIGPVGSDGSLPADTEAAVIWLLGDASTISLQLVEPAPPGARALPANTLFTGPAGATCVASRATPEAETTVHLVRPAGGTSTQPLVVGLPEGDMEVQANPPLTVRRKCRS